MAHTKCILREDINLWLCKRAEQASCFVQQNHSTEPFICLDYCEHLTCLSLALIKLNALKSDTSYTNVHQWTFAISS